MAVIAAVLGAACAGEPEPYGFHVGVGKDVPLPGVQAAINGLTTRVAFRNFSSYDDASGWSYVIESRYGDAVLDRLIAKPGLCKPQDEWDGSPLHGEWHSYLITRGGRIGIGSATCAYRESTLLADWFNISVTCNPLEANECNETGQRCALHTVHVDPLYAYLDCVPPGTLQLGEPCSQGAPGFDTGYDECAEGLLCVQGQCVALCRFDDECEGRCRRDIDGLPGYGYCGW